MEKLTKVLSIVLSFVLIFSGVTGIPLNISAEGANLELAFGEAIVAESTVTVPVEVVTNPGFRTLSVTVDYDEEVLQLTAAEKNAEFATVKAPGNDVPGDVGEFGQIVDEEGNNVTTGSYVMTWAYVVDEGDDVTTTDAEIATLIFEVVEGATAESTDITLTVTEASDSYKKAVAFTETVTGTVELTKPCEHTETKWVTDVEATPAAAGSKHEECVACGQQIGTAVEIARVKNLAFAGATIMLQDSVSLNFKVAKTFKDLGYTDIYVEFKIPNKRLEPTDPDYYTTFIVSEPTSEDETYFSYLCNKIKAFQMGDTIKATVYGTYNGVVYDGSHDPENANWSVDYGVYKYANNTLKKSTTKAVFKALIVDVLKYGGVSQTYSNYDVANPVLTLLADEQYLSFGSQTVRTKQELNSITKTDFVSVDNPEYAWRGAALVTDSSITTKLYIDHPTYKTTNNHYYTLEDFEGITLKVESGTKSWELSCDTAPEGTFVLDEKSGGMYIYFNGLISNQFSAPAYFTIYKDGKAVSNTLRYSIESYCYSQYEKANMAELVKAIIRFGDSARANFGEPNKHPVHEAE